MRVQVNQSGQDGQAARVEHRHAGRKGRGDGPDSSVRDVQVADAVAAGRRVKKPAAAYEEDRSHKTLIAGAGRAVKRRSLTAGRLFRAVRAHRRAGPRNQRPVPGCREPRIPLRARGLTGTVEGL